MARVQVVAAGRTPRLGGRTLGALAVAGVVIGFSLSSTLVKRAETPGVLVAFWRLMVATVVWNVYLWTTGRRVTMRHVRQALIPGVFFGLNLAIFLVGAINSVANAALISSLAPFFIVPIQIGTISIAQVVQPAVAVVWSFLLLGETLRLGQAVGIAVAITGLTAFLLLNQRGERALRAREILEVPVASDTAARPAVT